jgi:hypothetical protein
LRRRTKETLLPNIINIMHKRAYILILHGAQGDGVYTSFAASFPALDFPSTEKPFGHDSTGRAI